MFQFYIALMLYVGYALAIYSPGETRPVTVEAAIGDDFNVTCYMNPVAFPGKNSSILEFVNGRTDEPLPRQNMIVINSTTIVYMVKNAREQQMEYRCKCGKLDAIMETKVFVGTPPKPIKEFNCRSYDFDEMRCNFTKPHNPILTTYNVSYSNESPNYKYYPDCNYDHRYVVECKASIKNSLKDVYRFTVEASNALVGKQRPQNKPLVQQFTIKNLEITIPSKPGLNMRLDGLTENAIQLSFQMPNWEKYRPKGLEWQVIVKPENASEFEADSPSREQGELRLRIANLPYAYWNYELKMRVRVNNSDFWSEQFIYKFQTAARAPDRAPRIKPGSYYIDSTETNVTIYWEELLPFEYNGKNFNYFINRVKINGKLIDLKPLKQEKNLAKFQWNKYFEYEFEIYSHNEIGYSPEASYLKVYPLGHRNAKESTPLSIHNVYHANNRTYTLTWLEPPYTVGLQSYTVYWCYPKRALSNECREKMHFEEVPITQFNFTTEPQNAQQEHALILALSANYDQFNSGMHWADCTMDVNNDLVKMDPEFTNSANDIIVYWSVERVCTSILEGFNLTYCEVADDPLIPVENATCIQPLHFETIHKDDKKFNITNLKPFTTYRIQIYMFSRLKQGKPSDPELVRTSEGAPSPPRQLQVTSITNNSATITWLEPSQPNGIIRKYFISLNSNKTEVNSTTLSYDLKDLESFTSYKIYVLAETVETSAPSNDVHITTLTGVPSKPILVSSTTNHRIIQWSKPAKPRGKIDYYEVSVTVLNNNKTLRRKLNVINGTETECSFTKVPLCQGVDYQTVIEVRAINKADELANIENTDATLQPTSSYLRANENYELENVANDDEDENDLKCEGMHAVTAQQLATLKNYNLYMSPWQSAYTFSCSPPSTTHRIIPLALVAIFMSLGVMAALYMARKKYNKMANINCTLPAGLETYFTKQNINNTASAAGASFGDKMKIDLDTVTKAEDQWLQAARSHDFRNEHHHLLASLGNDSGYLCGGGGGHGGGVGIGCIMDASSDQLAASEVSNVSSDLSMNDDEVSAKDFSMQNGYVDNNIKFNLKKIKHTNLQQTLSITSNDVDSVTSAGNSLAGSSVSLQAATENVPAFPIDNAGGYIKQSWQQQQFANNFDYMGVEALQTAVPSQFNAAPSQTPCGYISVQNLNLSTKPAADNNNQQSACVSGGYVQQQDLQNIFLNSSLNNPSLPNVSTSAEQLLPSSDYIDSYHPHPLAYNEMHKQQIPQDYNTLNDLILTTPTATANTVNRTKETIAATEQEQHYQTPSANTIAYQDSTTASRSTTGISGYVTQQDLNLFAHNMN